MHSILDKVASKPCYIMGDYNLELLKHEINHPTVNFLDIMYANYFIPLINRPTRITIESSTLIDNIFSNNYNVNDRKVNGILKTDITDHYIIIHILSLKVEISCNDEHKIVRIINSSRIYWESKKHWLVYSEIISSMPNIFFKIPKDIQKYIRRMLSCDKGKNTV